MKFGPKVNAPFFIQRVENTIYQNPQIAFFIFHFIFFFIQSRPTEKVRDLEKLLHLDFFLILILQQPHFAKFMIRGITRASTTVIPSVSLELIQLGLHQLQMACPG